ncbi:MAG TPA: TIGR03067 domain-containing protein [Planctomycetaceae bacterium]|nr:TIGR03067 domain-containing protein [Planctomycetaceae bacterium]
MCRRDSILLLWCILLPFGEARSEDTKEPEKLEGTWIFVSTSAGANQKTEKRPAMRMVFKGDTVAFVAEGSNRTTKGTYTVGVSENQKTMNIVLDNDGKKLTTLAIYELDSDTLKLCHHLGGMASKERPKEFMADKQTVLGVLKREKSDK